MKDYDISVIMPSYNSEKTIGSAIDSILNQETEYNFEILIIDDGSSDKTIDIVKRRMAVNDNIRLFFQEHKFQAEARNKGIKNSNSKYIMFSDDDDLYKPDFIENMGKSIQTKKLVIAGIEKRFSDNHIEIEDHSILETAQDDSQLIGNYLTKNQEMDVGLWNKIFVKKVIDDNEIKMSNENFFEDSLFVLQYLMSININEIFYIHKPMYILNKHRGSTTNSYDSNLLNKCNKYINEVENVLKSNQNLNKYADSFRARIYLFYVHRSILNDKLWNKQKQKHILKTCLSFSTFKYLNYKYNLAILMAYFFPNTYIRLYSKK
ncbi:hypothetical protein BGL34_03835 [Fructilactobacillus lindneri]|uniref:Glycosyl transferase family 2 n=2 Tax=Fructilactobacillus lindneri TaxID=53444 RepID=A0A0R2JUW7_9LACO|nr:glycosyltransferase family 2 protein [Fructilactobacillus lindneri]ANZ57748.1 hypothetical protein AYR60_02705 [Fructilactobacillus lindneri]ANZ59017.1 hypothetical protein AYR59_02705 [Fructilactobacillus lindneri]KRN78812.1 glycosyl transferase family 2 [Fructilactobacillus lindneri DSM 20690 = JCM 11027]POG98044.1 hypothetical protein BGL31_04920 [Fructilactobacillus lindneri]POG99059.1 hypothetical protein BGL32_05865 [Fructilactobacillus lindneri]